MPHAIDREQPEREQHAVPQLRDGEDVPQTFEHGDPAYSRLSRTSVAAARRLDLLLRPCR